MKTVLSKQQPQKSLIQILKKHSGRNNAGRITTRHRGGQQKRYYRMIDFKRSEENMVAEVVNIEYDPNRTGNIALIKYANGQLRYILQPQGMKIGDKIMTGKSDDIKPGNVMQLQDIPLGVEIHNIELYPGKGGQMVKTAGSAAIILAKDGDYADVKLPSKEVRKVLLRCYATIGRMGNIEHKLEKLGKAGASRLRGRRPVVRGSVMSPRSHPHGGGEGRSSQGMHPKTMWGKPARGVKTRTNKRTTKFIVKSRKG